MRLATVEAKGKERLCLYSGQKLTDLNRGYALYAQKVGKLTPLERQLNMLQFLELGEQAITAARKVAEFLEDILSDTEVSNPLAKEIIFSSQEVKFYPPVPRPPKILCLAGNYVEHITESGWKQIRREQTTPWVFMKPPTTTLIGHKEQVLLPKVWRDIDWEVELAVVIGRSGKYISKEQAEHHIAGYTVFNDISARELELKKGRESREWDPFFDWFHGKCMDTFAPCGPCIVLKEQIEDVQNLCIRLKVNGEVKQDSNTANMLFPISEVVEFISQIMTLETGDIIATGTPSGTGAPRGEFLKSGDVIEAEIENIGTLINPVGEET
ncbi:MAG: fumarylacetoacetate hydrolase family protein [Candidatus Latescibacteria bacterium]|nr:fumarylacetoacetate hydrolase family protein [Candidatus Latescibacterota bacterium]